MMTNNAWSCDSLFAKAVLYQEQMQEQMNKYPNGWQQGLWSSLTLELLLRSALAHKSPVLLADSQNWRNIAYAIGQNPTTTKLQPISISTSEVIKRLKEIYTEFNSDIVNFCASHTERRNAELHTGERVYINSEWLAKYYQACSVLLKIIGKEVSDFFEDKEVVNKFIASVADDAAKSVKQDINAHDKVWRNKNSNEQSSLKEAADKWASRNTGHRVQCPSCKSNALLQGTRSGSVTTQILENEDKIIQKQTMIPASFECVACGLKIVGFSKLASCEMGNPFTGTTTYSAAEFFGLHTEDDLDEARRDGMTTPTYEADFND